MIRGGRKARGPRAQECSCCHLHRHIGSSPRRSHGGTARRNSALISPSRPPATRPAPQWDKDTPVSDQRCHVPGAGGLSPARNRFEADYALGWARNIWADALT
ncbi:FCSD flavin-binding domain-containing protein [Thioalkalicoccus limnaeus]|uniref:FCSD flavin-binding domain-containing protein n=1 Tax=Thioalkalicoccus limnaeus TaxID=120681 RepID=UPI0034E960A1